MKKSLVIGLLGFATAVAPSFGQGFIQLSNFSSSITPHPLQDVVYGAGANGTVGAGVNNTYTAGFYFVSGSQAGAFTADPSGTALPSALFTGTGTFAQATGAGSTGNIANATDVGGALGEYGPASSFQPGLGAGASVTVMIIAYDGSSYANATHRGHSAAFVMTTSTGTNTPQLTGSVESDGGFSVFTVPEPSALALSGLGAAALMLFRRKK